VPLVKDAVKRLVPLIPSPLRPLLRRLYRPLARFAAARPYQRKYSGRFLSEIHPDDDMLHHTLEVARGRLPAVGLMNPAHPLPYYNALGMYFTGGDFNVAEVENLLRGAGVSLGDAASLLEFACGYGRMTRHLVHKLSPSKITVADIAHDGVDFVSEKLAVAGFYSTTTGAALVHDQEYDVVLAVSLFSHLSIDDWEPWLKRLYELVNAGGVLLFTTLGTHAYEASVSQFGPDPFQRKAEGFIYTASNETRGRLTGTHYGVAFVSEEYVRRAVSRLGEGSELRYFPRGWTGYQDAYLLQRGPVPAHAPAGR
jgi:SAM-dependent methyltransferase